MKKESIEFYNKIKDLSKSKILDEYIHMAYPDQIYNNILTHTLLVKNVEDLENAFKNLENSMNNNAQSSNKLANKLFFLNLRQVRQ